MADMVKQVIDLLLNIKDMLVKFKRNSKECEKICNFVTTLSTELLSLQEAQIFGQPSLRAAMERLKDTLMTTQRKVQKCNSTSAILRAFQANDIAARLEELKNDISDKMLEVVLISSMSTNSQVERMDKKVEQSFISVSQQLDRNFDALYAFHGPLLKLTKILKQHMDISDSTDANNYNKKTGGPSTGITPESYSSWSDLVSATKLSDNNVIYKGSSSTVYKAEMYNEPVAVKKFDNFDKQVKERFVNELRLVRKLQHRNIVKLLGYCFEYKKKLILTHNDIRVEKSGVFGFISRYIPKQSMVEVIIKGKKKDVDWPCVLGILQGIAKGIRYLHKQNVLHLDLKPKNILLDSDMTPQINNFGKAKQLNDGVSEIKLQANNLPTEEKYVAPELLPGVFDNFRIIGDLLRDQASLKSDVYSFGVILLETIGLVCAASKEDRPTDPKAWAKRIDESELMDIFDRRRVTEAQMKAAKWCVIVGLLCCQRDPQRRPSIWKVIDMLGSCTREEEYIGTNKPSSTSVVAGNSMLVTSCECMQMPHWPVSCDMAHRWLEKEKLSHVSSRVVDRSYWEHYERWENSQTLAQNAIKDMQYVTDSWIWNMADRLGIEVTELDFLNKACEEIVCCRQVIPWVQAFRYFLDYEHNGNKRRRLDRLLEQATRSLGSLQAAVAEQELANLCAEEVEVIIDLYPRFKEKLTNLTGETQKDFEELVRGVLTDFQD